MAKGAAKGLELGQPAGVAVRALILQQLSAARKAYAALRKGKDPEALHDLRVALRRTRSMLGAYRGEIALKKRTRRELRDLAAATNPARDAEVRLAIFSALPPPGAARARPGVAWAGQRLAAETAAGARTARDALAGRFESLCRHIEHGLEPPDDDSGTTWCAALGARLDTAWTELDGELQALHAQFSMDTVHRLRIEMKRMRYLLEPLVPLLPPAKALVDETRDLQTLFGDLRDAQLFGEWLVGAAEAAGAARGRAELQRALGVDNRPEDPAMQAMPGLAYLAKTLCARELALEAQARAWVAGEGAGRLAAKVGDLRAAL